MYHTSKSPLEISFDQVRGKQKKTNQEISSHLGVKYLDFLTGK